VTCSSLMNSDGESHAPAGRTEGEGEGHRFGGGGTRTSSVSQPPVDSEAPGRLAIRAGGHRSSAPSAKGPWQVPTGRAVKTAPATFAPLGAALCFDDVTLTWPAHLPAERQGPALATRNSIGMGRPSDGARAALSTCLVGR
jgi:hypothetical protein